MNDQQIDAAVRELPRWKMVPCSGGCVAHMTDTNGPGYVHSEHVAILLRRVRDAEQERCAKIGDNRAANWSSFAEQEEREGDPYGDKGPETFSNWEFEAVEYAKAIRAPRTEGQHGQG